MELNEYAKMYDLEDSHWWFLGKRKVAEKMIAKYVSFSSDDLILDVGCGTGGMMRVLENYGKAFGLDICSSGLQFACQRGLGDLIQGSALELPFADNTFSLITSFDVLYHEDVVSDLQALKEYYRICRPGGFFLMTDSALPILSGQHDKAYHAARRYTATELRAKVSQAGFRVEKLSYLNALLFPAVFTVRFWKRHVHSHNGADSSDLWALPPALNSILYSIYSLEASLLTRMNLPIGSSLICIARKVPESVQER